jgi:hypothetical protein
MVHKNIAIGLDLVETNSSHFYQSCNARKQYRESFLQEGATRVNVPLELVTFRHLWSKTISNSHWFQIIHHIH